MKNDSEHLKRQIISKIDYEISPLEFRLDILKLCFLIESQLEDVIWNIFKSKSVKETEIINYFIQKDNYYKFKKWYKENRKDTFYKIWSIKKDESVNFHVNNFIDDNTFGGLLKFIEVMKFDPVKKMIHQWIPNIEFKIFKKWMKYIKDIRNILAHRTNINPETFFEKISTPAQSKKLKTEIYSNIELRKKIFSYFLNECDENICHLLNKYGI